MTRLLLPLFLLICTSEVEGQKLHAFIFCNTDDAKIGQGAVQNMAHIKLFVQNIARGLGYKLVYNEVAGKEFTIQTVNKKIQTGIKSITQRDVVIVYFNAHGYKSPNDTDYFPKVEVGGKLLSTFDFHGQLCRLDHRLLLTIVDACSEYKPLDKPDSFLITRVNMAAAEKIMSELYNERITNYNYQGFFDHSGSFIISAGQPGSFTYSSSVGSFFTSSFIRAVYEAVDTSNHLVDWEELLQKVSNYTFANTKYFPTHPKPIWSYEPCGTPQKIHTGTSHSYVTGIDVTSSYSGHKTTKGKKIYTCFFRPDTKAPLDSVSYYLPYHLSSPVITLRPSDSVDVRYAHGWEIKHLSKKELRGHDFNYWDQTTEQFPFMVKLYVTDGDPQEIYMRVFFPEEKSWWTEHKKSMVLYGLVGVILIIAGFFIFKRLNYKI